MSRALAKKWVSFLSVYALFACALAAQSSTVRLILEASEQPAFWGNIQGFKPVPVERLGDLATFSIDPPTRVDSFYLQLLTHFRQRSFLLASLDTFPSPVANTRVLSLGPAMRWVSLRAGAGFANENWLATAGFRVKNFTDKPLRHASVLKLEQTVLEQAENNGYPFASVWLDSVLVQEDGRVSAVLQIDRNSFFEFKTFRIKGDVKLPKAYLSNYLGIKAGMPYSRARVLRLRDQLRSLAFLEPTANPMVTFTGTSKPSGPSSAVSGAGVGEATINLFLQKKRASRFDFLIGLLPRPNATDGRLLVTGSLSAAFQNALNLGEHFSAELERLRPETQKVDIQAGVPYLLGTSFGAEARLGIFRRDSTWTDAQSEAGISYLFLGADNVRFFWENKRSSLQKVDTLAVLASRELPRILDYKQNGFGLEAAFSRLDYRFNPRKGWSLIVKAAAGFITALPNAQIVNLQDPANPEFSFSTLYDSVAGRDARYRTELRGELFVPIFVRSTIKLGLRGGGIFSETPVYANENYRLGGNKLLRGFDEESIFATRFLVGTAEWRLLTGQNSFLSVFADWGYLENLAANNRIFLHPLGLGAGLNFETRAGIFGISAAVGRRDVGQSVDFRATKFHLGYVSLF